MSLERSKQLPRLTVSSKGLLECSGSSSDEVIFDQEQKSNKQNSRWFCKDIEDVGSVEHTTFLYSLMVLGIMSGQKSPKQPLFLHKSLTVTAKIYQEVLDGTVKPRMEVIPDKIPYLFQQRSAQAQKAKETGEWLIYNFPHHRSLDFWAPSSPGCYPLD